MYEQEPNTELPSDIRWMRRGTFALLGLGLLALVLFLAWKGAHASVFDWRLLKIEGDVQRNSLATLRANALPRLQGNFMTTPLGEVRAAFEAVPWVRQATVQRVWPRQLLVRLEEHKAIAYWDGRGEFGEPPLERALLNTDSEVFHANLGEVEDEELPQLAGPSGSEGQVLRMWQRLNELARPHQQALTRLELSGRGSWRAQFESGASVELGRGEAEQLAARFASFLPHAMAVARRFQTQIQSVDLRHPDGYALKLVGIGTKKTPEPTRKPRKP